jgi:hypothetical protein
MQLTYINLWVASLIDPDSLVILRTVADYLGCDRIESESSERDCGAQLPPPQTDRCAGRLQLP